MFDRLGKSHTAPAKGVAAINLGAVEELMTMLPSVEVSHAKASEPTSMALHMAHKMSNYL